MSQLRLAFYADDFTGSTDALEQLARAGIRTALFTKPPTPAQLRRFPGLMALGVAGRTRSLPPRALERELEPTLRALKRLGARHVHYKVCSTFDSAPHVGNIGRAMDVGARVFPAAFIPLLVAAPALGRYTVFGQHFARFGIGSAGQIHRLDRHPAISRHPVTPMEEADLRQHLAKQTAKTVGLLDILQLDLPQPAARAAFDQVRRDAEVVLFDALTDAHLGRIGALLDGLATRRRPLFSVGSSGVEAALAMTWTAGVRGKAPRSVRASQPNRTSQPNRAWRPGPLLVGSGSCSPVTSRQIERALRHGFVEVALEPAALAGKRPALEIQRAASTAARLLGQGRSVIVHTTRTGSNPRIVARLQDRTASVLGSALGTILRATAELTPVRRICVAGGDTSSYAAPAMGIEALEMIAPLTPGAPLCRALAAGSPVDGCEIVFKGGQVGADDYFETISPADHGNDGTDGNGE